MKKTRYPVTGAEQAPASTTLRIRTRIHPSERDRFVLMTLAEHFSALQGRDLAARCRAGKDHDKTVWARRKRELTKECSARWAGRVTKASNDAYATARRNQRRQLADTLAAIEAIEKKLRLPIASTIERKALVARERDLAKTENRKPRRLSFGYHSRSEHAMKRMRLQVLEAKCARLEADLAAGRVHVTRGGKKLLGNRLHLEEAGLTVAQWRTRWHAARLSFGANGEANKVLGNETIRLWPDGTLEVDLPRAFGHLHNVTDRGTTRYRLDAEVAFSYRREEWLAQVETSRACAYDVSFRDNGRIHLDASFSPEAPLEVPTLEELKEDPGLRVLAVDLNHGFVAPVVLDRSGNPLHLLSHVPLVTEGLSATTRDGHLRACITTLLDLAEVHGCRLLVVENLGFAASRATGRERYGANRRFRRTVCAIPTAQFRDRLVAMASRRGVAVAGVPAAYSSIWGAEHWQRPLSTPIHKVSRHTAAAVVLGRRALGHSARRRLLQHASPGVTAPDQRIEDGATEESVGSAPGAASYHAEGNRAPTARHHVPRPTRRHPRTHETRRGDANGKGASPAKTVRAGPSGSRDGC